MKRHLVLAMFAVLGLMAISARAAIVLPPGYQVTTPLGAHQTFTQAYHFYDLPQAVWSGDVEIMNGPEVVELCEFVPEAGHPADSVEAELIPVWSDTAPPLLPNTVQINWGHGSMTDYYPGDNSYCIGTVCNAVPLPASGPMSAAGVMSVIIALAIKSRRKVIG